MKEWVRLGAEALAFAREMARSSSVRTSRQTVAILREIVRNERDRRRLTEWLKEQSNMRGGSR